MINKRTLGLLALSIISNHISLGKLMLVCMIFSKVGRFQGKRKFDIWERFAVENVDMMMIVVF